MTWAPSFIRLEVEPVLHLSLVGSVMQRGGGRSPEAAQATSALHPGVAEYEAHFIHYGGAARPHSGKSAEVGVS